MVVRPLFCVRAPIQTRSLDVEDLEARVSSEQAKAKRSKTMQQQPEDRPPEEFVSDRGFKYLFLPVLSLSVAAHLLASYWGTPFLWGLHFLYFFPRWLGWALTVVTLGFFVPPVGNLILKALESLFSGARRIFAGTDRYLLFIRAGIISLPIFWFGRTRLFLLGDGYFKLEALASGHITRTEPLDSIIHHQFYRLLTNLFPGSDPSLAYTVPSVVCGGAFIFLIWCWPIFWERPLFKKF